MHPQIRLSRQPEMTEEWMNGVIKDAIADEARIEQLGAGIRATLERLDRGDKGTFDDRISGLTLAMVSDLRTLLDGDEKP